MRRWLFVPFVLWASCASAANKFCWTGGDNSTGLAWDTAYTSCMRDWGAEGGFTPGTDFVYVRSVHAESAAGPLTITGSTAEGTTDQVRLISVVGDTTGTDPGALAAGASVTATGTTDISIVEGIYIYGVDFFASDDIFVGSGAVEGDVTLETCRLELTGTDGGDFIEITTTSSNRATLVTFLDTDIDFANAAQGISARVGKFVWDGGTVDFDVTTLFETVGITGPMLADIRNVDMSVMTSSSVIVGAFNVNAAFRFIFSRCLFATGMSLVNGTIDNPGVHIESYHCQIGTDADPALQMETHTDRGSVTLETARNRDNGASDGVTSFSWSLDTSAGSKRNYPGHPLQSPPFNFWLPGDGTSQTLRFYIASGAAQGDDDIWPTCAIQNSAATDSLGERVSGRVAPETAATNWTTDASSTWNGTDVGTLQQMDLTVAPDKDGIAQCWIEQAIDSERISLDARVAINP